MKLLMVLHSNGRLLALRSKIRLEWKCMEVADTLAYYNTEKIMIVKTFIVYTLGHFFMIQTDGYLQRTITILQEVKSTNIGNFM